MKIDIVIPTYKPDKDFIEILQRLCKQTIPVNRVIVMNTNEQDFVYDIPTELMDKLNIDIHHVDKASFDHGGTRHAAMMMSDARICILMTQDAVPVDERLIERLVEPFEREDIATAYARQLACDTSSIVEKLTREFNYPDEDQIKGIEDIKRLQIKTYFCSNVCCAYRRDIYEKLGGFERKTIFNEDMLYAAKAQKAGFKVAYCSKAKVYHSHDYSGAQQFRRNFDNGVSHAQHPEVFGSVRQNGEGVRMMKTVILNLIRSGRFWLIPGYIYKSGCKYIGFKLGCRYQRLPHKLVLACTSDKTYFE